MLDLPVFVNQDVTLGDLAAPRNFGMRAAEFLRNPAGSFSDDLNEALYGKLQFAVSLVGIKCIPAVNSQAERAESSISQR